MRYRIEVYHGKRGGWYIRVRARNGKIVMDGGEAYTRKVAAMRAVNRFVNAFTADKVIIEQL